LGQNECDDGNNMDGDGCDHNCKIEPGYACYRTNGPDKCVDILPPTSKLSLYNGNKLKVTFSEPMISKLDSDSLAQTMNVILIGAPNNCEFNWTLNCTFEAYEIITEMNIVAYAKCSLQNNAQIFQVAFTKPLLVTDTSNNTLTTPTMQVYSKRFVYIPDSEKAAMESTGSAFDSSSSVTFILLLGFSMFQSVAMGSFWAFINMLQMISFLPLINVELPSFFETVINDYLTIKRVSIPLKALPDFIFNPLELLASFITKPFNTKFIMSGYDSLSFLFNFADELFTWVCIFFFYLFLRFLTAIIPRGKYFLINIQKNKRFKFIIKMRKDYEYNAVLRILFESYLNMNFCAILNLWSVFL